MIQQKVCPWCGKTYRPRITSSSRPSQGKYCSRQCYNEWQRSDGNRGSNSPGWVDGGKHEEKMNRLRKTPEWETWRQAVYSRDDYTCAICRNKGGRLHPHHIIKKSECPDLIFDCANGITLCSSCHRLRGIHVAGGEYEMVFREMVRQREASMMHIRSLT